MSFFSAILSKFLDQYINKVNGKQFKFSFIDGHAELHNVSLTPNMLISFGIPLIIKESKVEQIVVDFPIMKNTNKATYLKIINVDIFSSPEWDTLNKMPTNSLTDMIQSMEDEKKATKLESRKAWNSWFEKVIDNATIEIRNIRIHIEFSTFNGKTSGLTLFLDSLLMNTIDSDGNIIILNKKPEILTKRVRLSSFAIALHTNIEPFKNFDQLNEIQFNLLQDSSFNLIMIHDRRKKSKFLNSFSLNVDPIFLNLNQEQFFALQYLFNDFSKSQKRQKFLCCMKPSTKKIDTKHCIKMWCYLHRCAIKIRRAHDFRSSIALQFLKKRKEFVIESSKAIIKKKFIKKSIEKFGEDLTYLLFQYSYVVIRRNERMIKLDKKEIDAIKNEDLDFFSKESLHFEANLQGICINVNSLLLLSINNINALYEKKRNKIKLNLEVKNWLVDDLASYYKVVQTNQNDNFIKFQILSRDDPAVLSISSFKIDVRSSFLHRFCQFFLNPQQTIQNEESKTKDKEEKSKDKVKSSAKEKELKDKVKSSEKEEELKDKEKLMIKNAESKEDGQISKNEEVQIIKNDEINKDEQIIKNDELNNELQIVKSEEFNQEVQIIINDELNKDEQIIKSEELNKEVTICLKDESNKNDDNDEISKNEIIIKEKGTIQTITNNIDNDNDEKENKKEINQKVKSSDLNQYLLLINPRTLMRFKIILSGVSMIYSIDDEASKHSFSGEIKNIEFKNYSKSSTETKLIVKTKMNFGQIKLNDSVLSEDFSLKSTTTGLIDEFYFLAKIDTNLDVCNAKIDMDSQIVEKMQSVISSITSNTQSYSTKIYSSHTININCCDISIFINTGLNSFFLTISGIDVKPSLLFRDISFIEKNGVKRLNFPSLTFKEWPIIETKTINVNLNANEFYSLLDEMKWISNQATKIYSSVFPSTENNGTGSEFKVISNEINYKMGNLDYLMKFNDSIFNFGTDWVFEINSFGIFNTNKKQFLSCDNKMTYISSISGENYFTLFHLTDLKIEFLWNELNNLIEYFKNLGPYYENNESTIKWQYIYGIEIDKFSMNIENQFTFIIDKLLYDYQYPKNMNWGICFEKMNIIDLLEINDFNYQNNGFFFDLSISSIVFSFSPSIPSKISNLSFISKLFDKKSTNQQSSQSDMFVYINNIKIIESLTKLTISIPIIKFTTNSLYSISALHIPMINFESLKFNLEVFLLYNSIDFHTEKIDQVFLLERKNQPENKKLELTNVLVDINSIDFEYTHYFVMRIYNAFKVYSKFLPNFNMTNDTQISSNYTISAVIHRINIKEHNITESIQLLELIFKKNKDELIEFKCHSINCIELIKKREEENEHRDFFVIQKSGIDTHLIVNPIDIYVNIETIKKLNNIYESLSSLIKTNRDEELNKFKIQKETKEKYFINDQNYTIDLNGVQIHFPFEDDPSLKVHDLILSFDVQIKIQDYTYKLLNITKVNMFFANYSKQKEMCFLPLYHNDSFRIQVQKDSDDKEKFHYSSLEIDIGKINIYLSVLDIFELRLIIDYFKQLIISLLNPKSYSVPDESLTRTIFSIDESHFNIKPISISFCEESRASLPIFTICIEETKSTLNLPKEKHEFAIVFDVSIIHNNFFFGKFETFMPRTEFLILYSNTDSNDSYFGFSVKNDIEFNLTPYSFRSLIKFIDKFQNEEEVLKCKDISRFNYNPEYWIRNSLDDIICIQYNEKGSDRSSHSTLYISPSESLPLCQINQDNTLTFKYKEIKGYFVPRKLVFPTYFEQISVSIHHHDNYSQTIVFHSPLSIQNRLNTNITIFINSINDSKHFDFYATLSPKCAYPLPLEERNYFILSDFETNVDPKKKEPINPSKIDQNNPPEIFSLSKNKSPQFIKIQNIENKNLISFILNVNNDLQTNSRIYEIIPSFFIRNNSPCSITSQFYIKENIKVNNGCLTLKSLESSQINLFNHDTQNLLISLGFDSESFQKPTLIKLDKFDEIYAGCKGTAIVVKKLLKTEQREIVVFSPCAIFNKTQETIYFSGSSGLNSNIHKLKPQDFTLYGLASYSEHKKKMKIDISIENSETKNKAIDCMRLNSNCSTIFLPRKDNDNLFYPINCSITLGKFPMNTTHIVTFTNYLYVINNLPFDFVLIPVTSNKLNSIEADIDNFEVLHQEIENESKSLLDYSFFIPKGESNSALIKWIPKDGMFLFSVHEYPNNPIVQLNNITRTVFRVKNKEDQICIELNIYENQSTLFASFQIPTFPVPLIINNSLDLPIIVYQNIKPFKNKHFISANSSSLFAFDEPFINNKQIYIEITTDGENYKKFLFSMEGQLSPLISEEFNINIFTTVISKNISKMIQVRYLSDKIVYQSTFRGFLSIHSLRFSLSNDDMNEIVLVTLNDINSEVCQDNKNTFLTLSVKSIQIDDQNTASKFPVVLFGTGQDLLNENKEKNSTNKFFNLVSIFPRGVPFFSVVNFLSIQIQPIFIIAESNFLVNLLSFLMYHFLSKYKNKNIDSENDSNYSSSKNLEPSFNSVNVNKIIISYFEINPINLVINIPSETKNDHFYIATFKWILRMISMNKLMISIPKLFVTEFNNNISYFADLLWNFYGRELMKQISKNAVIQFFASYLLRFKKFHFISLSSIENDNNNNNTNDDSDSNLCDNRKPLYKYFNQIELNYIDKESNFYFNQSPDVIKQLINQEYVSNILVYHPNNNDLLTKKSNRNDRLILGITNDSNLITKVINIDLTQLFQANEIKRVRIPYISPIYSSFDDPLGSNSKIDSNVEDILKLNNSSENYNIYIKIQSEILNSKTLKNQNIKFIIQDKNKEWLYCITNEMILIFKMNQNSIKIDKEINLMKFSKISASGYIVTLSSDIEKVDQIEIEFNRRTDAKTLVSFITSQQTVIDIFGNILSQS